MSPLNLILSLLLEESFLENQHLISFPDFLSTHPCQLCPHQVKSSLLIELDTIEDERIKLKDDEGKMQTDRFQDSAQCGKVERELRVASQPLGLYLPVLTLGLGHQGHQVL